ncbi:MAG: GbsR/MarR family transcriptional regulator [Pseudomonadota bacterium]
MDLPPLKQRFVMHFGEMGARWGVSRTVGQIYAVLFLSDRPLCADDLVAQLGIARSNVSISLKELQSWRLVRLMHLPGDRRDFFTTPDDLWEIVRTLGDERKKREIDPTLTLLRELVMETPASEEEAHAQTRMTETVELIELLDTWYQDVRRLEPDRLIQLLALGSAVQKILEMKDRLRILPGGKAPKRGADPDAEAGAGD